jgi:hypothetical protein
MNLFDSKKKKKKKKYILNFGLFLLANCDTYLFSIPFYDRLC